MLDSMYVPVEKPLSNRARTCKKTSNNVEERVPPSPRYYCWATTGAALAAAKTHLRPATPAAAYEGDGQQA